MSCTIRTDAEVGANIVQVSTSDSCINWKNDLTQSHVGLRYLFFTLAAAVIPTATGQVLIARAVTQVVDYSLSAALVIDISYE